MDQTTLAIVTFLWRDLQYRWNNSFTYGVDHVNRLAASVKRNLKRPHRFICVTDYGDVFDDGIDVVPIWDDLAFLGGCYRRLRAFSPEMKDLFGPRFVWLDLDCVVVGELDPVFDRPEPFVAWKDVTPPTPYCGSMIMMDAGARRQVWDDFDVARTPLKLKAGPYVGTDQAWIGTRLGTEEATWDETDGVLSFSAHTKDGLPEGARIVFFHGRRDPSMPDLQRDHQWIKDHWRT